MTAFHTIAVPHDDILAGQEHVREEVGKVGQQGRLWE